MRRLRMIALTLWMPVDILLPVGVAYQPRVATLATKHLESDQVHRTERRSGLRESEYGSGSNVLVDKVESVNVANGSRQLLRNLEPLA